MERKDHGGQRDITGTLSTGRKDDLLVANLTRCRARIEADWNFFASLGVDAIYSDIPLGVRLQPAIPDL